MNRVVTVILSILLISSCDFQSEKRSLVSVSEIDDLLNSDRVLQIIDVRPYEEYLTGHIPSAVQVWRSDIENHRAEIEGMRIEKREFEILLGKMGISDKDSVYIYDAKGNVDAARLWWLLRYYGFEKVALIDGGLIQWQMEGYQKSEGGSVVNPAHFRFPVEPPTNLLATKEDIQSEDFDHLIDARTEKEFSGELIKNGALRPGHILESIHLNYGEFIAGGSLKIRPKDEVLTILANRGICAGDKVITYCHSGVRSAFTTFVMREVAGFENVLNYDGSWIEWSRDESLPVSSDSQQSEIQ